MNLWIRSQDRMNLVKVNQISINYSNSKRIIANYIPDFVGTQGEYYEILGDYESKERALEVLDEIQSFIENNYEVDIPSCSGNMIANGRIVLKTRRIVYEMPKE